MRYLTYAIQEDGLVLSRLNTNRGNDLIACPVLQFEQIGMGGNGFEPGDFRGPTNYKLEAFPLSSIAHDWPTLKWTRKIPIPIKNKHRRFFGFKPLPYDDPNQLRLF